MIINPNEEDAVDIFECLRHDDEMSRNCAFVFDNKKIITDLGQLRTIYREQKQDKLILHGMSLVRADIQRSDE